MDVEARVAQLGDLLGKELDSLRGVAEDDGLVNLELWRRAESVLQLRNHTTEEQRPNCWLAFRPFQPVEPCEIVHPKLAFNQRTQHKF